MAKIHFQKQRNSEHHEYELSKPEASALARLLDFLPRNPEYDKTTSIVIQRADPAPGQSVLGPVKLEPGKWLNIGISGHNAALVDGDEETAAVYARMYHEMVESNTITVRVDPLE